MKSFQLCTFNSGLQQWVEDLGAHKPLYIRPRGAHDAQERPTPHSTPQISRMHYEAASRRLMMFTAALVRAQGPWQLLA